jgi:hypothetical protein
VAGAVKNDTGSPRGRGWRIAPALARHASGDWGLVDASDKRANDDRALIEGTRLLSAYELANGTRIWIITEADRAATTVLLPAEY